LKLLGGITYLRGAILKLGQILATHPEVSPEQYADVLGRLHFEPPPMHALPPDQHLDCQGDLRPARDAGAAQGASGFW
jgi:predicted unusual protein kinase regulating ubiquinone biosynthesis (AarF/ABC1/UbiB family)